MNIYFAFPEYNLLITVAKETYLKFKRTFLYIKTHNKTGLKYFGKTTSANVHKYVGSGKYWKLHIAKHGYDVTTAIVGEFTSFEECITAAIDFSKRNNIVLDDNWANLKDETLDGGWNHINSRNDEEAKSWRRKGHITHPGKIWGAHQDKNICMANSEFQKEMGKRGGLKVKELGLGWFSEKAKENRIIAAKSIETRTKHSNTAKLNRSYDGSKNSQYGTKWVHSKNLELAYRVQCDLVERYLELGWEMGAYSRQFSKNGKLDKTHMLTF